jgi:hypothetical protein
MADLIVGPPATGERFYDREELIKSIWDRLEVGSILFVAPRRFGKTSVMLHLRDNPKPGYIPIYLDVEWLESPTQFVVELTGEMARNLPGYRKAFRGVAGLPGSLLDLVRDVIDDFGIAEFKIKLRQKIGKEWRDLGKELIKLAKSIDGKVLLMLDELPLMLKRMLRGEDSDSVELLLYWLRSFREGPDAVGNMRFIIGGSIGVQHILTQAGATASMNDLENIKVEPFPEDVARNLVSGLFREQGQRAGEPVIEQVLQEVEVFVPFFLQMLVRATCDLARDRRKEVSPSLVSEAYRERLISVESRNYFEHFYSRLRDYYDVDDEQAAKVMLRGLALKGRLSIQELHNIYMQAHSKPSDEGFGHLLGDLENDFYLRRQDSFYIFHTKILRDWWVRFYGFELFQ